MRLATRNFVRLFLVLLQYRCGSHYTSRDEANDETNEATLFPAWPTNSPRVEFVWEERDLDLESDSSLSLLTD